MNELIHTGTVMGEISRLPNTVIVANDRGGTDKIQQTLMKTVVPDSIAIRFFSLQKVIDIILKQILLKRYLLF